MDTQPIPATDALALAMMNSFGQLSLIMMHMHQFKAEGRSDQHVPDPPFALTEVLKKVLPALAEDHEIEDIATAAQMLGSATQLIGDEVFIVDLDHLDLDFG